MGDRCEGHCCRAFFLAQTPAVLRALADDASPIDAAELRQIADMIVPIREVWGGDPSPMDDRFHTYESFNAIGKRDMGHPPIGALYTCRNFDERSGQCTSYETRPGMCRDFPYTHRCPFRGCTWSAVKGPVDRRGGRVALVVLKDDALAPVLDMLESALADDADAARAFARCRDGNHRHGAEGTCADCSAEVT